MTEKKLKKLSRAELLEILIAQTKEVERLSAELQRAEAELACRRLKTEKAGDLAHAVLEVNGVMAAAKEAAAQYLENIKAMHEEARQESERIIAEAERKADEIIASARKEAESE